MPRSILSLAVASLILIGAQLSLIEAHLNTVAVTGSKVIMKCQTSSGNCTNVQWRKRIGQAEVGIFKNNRILVGFGDQYSVDSSSGCNFVIKNVSLTDAGRFICDYVNQERNTMNEASLLFVFESLPKCSVRVNVSSEEGIAAEGDGVQFTCKVRFNATEGGVSMTWKSVDNVSAPVKPNTNGSLVHSIVAKRSGIPSFECITTFDIPKDIRDLATNIPTVPPCTTEYNKTLLYRVTNVTLAPSLSFYSFGSTITCSSDGIPPASYRWESLKILDGSCGIWSNVSGERGYAFRTAENNNTTGWYRCVASNTIRGKSFAAFSRPFQVIGVGHNFATTYGENIRSEETSSNVFAIAFFIGVLSSLLVVCAVFFILTKTRYVHFHRPSADEGKQDDVDMGSAKKPVEAATSDTKNEGDETAYASLGEERSAQHSYASLAEIRK